MGYPEAQYVIDTIMPVVQDVGEAVSEHGVQTFTSNGTFAVPEGVTKIWVTAAGGGGGGGACYSQSGVAAGGGGGGSCVLRKPFTVTPGEQIAITIGNGGSAGTWTNNSGTIKLTDGGTGGSTVIGSLLTLSGGTGGSSASSGGSGGNGGTGGGGGGGASNSSSSSWNTPRGGSGYINGQNAVYTRYDNSTKGAGNGGGGFAGGNGGKGGGNTSGGGGGGSVGDGGNGAIKDSKSATSGVYGGGGGGGVSSSYTPGAGGKGIAIIEW